MKNKFIILISSLAFALFSSTSAKSESITLGWAAWDPANALVELNKGFTEETGIEVNHEFVPWTSFADRMLNELNNQGKTFDLLKICLPIELELFQREWLVKASQISKSSRMTGYLNRHKVEFW